MYLIASPLYEESCQATCKVQPTCTFFIPCMPSECLLSAAGISIKPRAIFQSSPKAATEIKFPTNNIVAQTIRRTDGRELRILQRKTSVTINREKIRCSKFNELISITIMAIQISRLQPPSPANELNEQRRAFTPTTNIQLPGKACCVSWPKDTEFTTPFEEPHTKRTRAHTYYRYITRVKSKLPQSNDKRERKARVRVEIVICKPRNKSFNGKLLAIAL